MPKMAYIDKKFRPATLDLIEKANVVIAEYKQMGFDLTLRQLYYQFVSKGYIENNERSYKNFGSAIDDGRLAGLIDWDAIVDRTRNLKAVSHWATPADIIDSAAYSYRIDKWATQPWYVECWVEKEALVGVIQRISTRLDIPYFACRGYVSQSEMWAAARRHLRARDNGKKSLILHLGDHDPSGIDMTRDIMDRLALFGASVTVERLALNWDQVEEYNPPPNPAKLTDSRANGYIDRFGLESWELDALTPTVLSDLIEKAVLAVRNESAWERAVSRETRERNHLGEVKDRWEEVVEFLGGDVS